MSRGVHTLLCRWPRAAYCSRHRRLRQLPRNGIFERELPGNDVDPTVSNGDLEAVVREHVPKFTKVTFYVLALHAQRLRGVPLQVFEGQRLAWLPLADELFPEQLGVGVQHAARASTSQNGCNVEVQAALVDHQNPGNSALIAAKGAGLLIAPREPLLHGAELGVTLQLFALAAGSGKKRACASAMRWYTTVDGWQR